MIKLGRNEIREVIQLTGLADAFNKAVWVEADGKIEMSEVRLNEFWKAHKLPMTKEDYKKRLRYNFQLAKHPSLIRRYRKGDFAVVSFAVALVIISSDYRRKLRASGRKFKK